MNILYYGAGWPTNIGNAFIDLGAMACLKEAFPEANIAFASEIDASKSLWFAVSSELSGNQNILTWTDCVGEHLLRAYNIRRLREEDPVLAELSITSEQSSGYLYARQFLGLLDTYSRGRKQWAGLSAFLPEMTTDAHLPPEGVVGRMLQGLGHERRLEAELT